MDDNSKPLKIDDIVGSLPSAMKEVVAALDNLLKELNTMHTQGILPMDQKLDHVMIAGMLAVQLGKLHLEKRK